MAATIDENHSTYQQAYKAYVQQKYEEAADLIEKVASSSDPNIHLLRGHIYYVLQEFETAIDSYKKVLQLTNDPEIADCARGGLDNISNYQQSLTGGSDRDSSAQLDFSDFTAALGTGEEELTELGVLGSRNGNSSKSNETGVTTNPFDMPADTTMFASTSDSIDSIGSSNPFELGSDGESFELGESQDGLSADFELPGIWQSKDGEKQTDETGDLSFWVKDEQKSSTNNQESVRDIFSEAPVTPITQKSDATPAPTESKINQNGYSTSYSSIQENFSQTEGINSTFTLETKQNSTSVNTNKNSLLDDDSFDFEAFESAFGSSEFNSATNDSQNNTKSKDYQSDLSADLSSELNSSFNVTNGKNGTSSTNNIEFLDDFEDFDDLNIPGFEITGETGAFSDATMHGGFMPTSGTKGSAVASAKPFDSSEREGELFSITGSHEAVPVFTASSDASKIDPTVQTEQGLLAFLENAPLSVKPWYVAGTCGVISAIVVASVTFVSANFFSSGQQRQAVQNTGWMMTLAALVSGAATAGAMGNLATKQIRKTTQDLQAQFDAVRQGNLNVQATVYSEDELGKLSAGFNEMARVIFTTTNEATRKAAEQEEAKENLQRQVIRLLDDVEGAARGDLTVQAEVTADVLGAVADAFNLTIQNLRDIVQQVKVAAREVTKGATNSETFARALSSDALRQAEELAVTLNSVQVMTDSIQRVAEAAREAETVARDASSIALKGGEAVENTVAGILEIRETVAETTRKVKRLAESSQEISKIVALISQIASRTNLLALNASIEAARAGEAGRGFAIVADEVRQLADKSAKSLKEIEQIVMQIQSETGSVMTAMEEGTQQVIKGTKLAEEAKRSLENIIQVANRIDILVRSITTDTAEQTDVSRAVAQVMQSVELTAQETSQEAQRVSGALQHLVSVSRDLISSVERFRVETTESR